MIKQNLKEQLGFTLIELLVVVALVGIISGVLALTIGTATRMTSITTPQNMLVSQVHLAGSWISGDVHSCNGTITAGTPGTPGPWSCSMYRYQWNDTASRFDVLRIDYTIAGGIMTRSVYKEVSGLWTIDSQQEVARYISGSGTTTTFVGPTASNTYLLNISAVSGSETINQFYKIIWRGQ
jgi:prepilin-type N-terminal cleavage/methylation domain-containing protein